MERRTSSYLVAAIALGLATILGCSDGAPTGPIAPRLTAADLIGSYKLVQFDGQNLPAVRAASSANDFKADTVIGGCLLLGPGGDRPPMNASDYVSVTLFFAGVSDTVYVDSLTKCPPWLPADHQGYTWDGSKGSWAFCGQDACDRTDFVAMLKDDKLTIVTGPSGHETSYARW